MSKYYQDLFNKLPRNHLIKVYYELLEFETTRNLPNKSVIRQILDWDAQDPSIGVEMIKFKSNFLEYIAALYFTEHQNQ